MKKAVSAALAATMAVSASSAVMAGSEAVTVIVDGSTLVSDVAPQIINDRTMVPMRAIFETLGATVEWDGEARKITSKRGDTTIEMTVDNKTMYINGKAVELDTAPTIVNDRTLVPTRAAAEGLDAEVEWLADSKTVLILDKAKDSVVKANIEVTDYGSIDLVLFENVAPITVANFKKLAEDKFYDGLIFHRVISGFMVQGGGYDDTLVEKDAEMIKGEFTSNGVENNLKHTRGVISMARQGQDHDDVVAKDSASSQFFIMHKDSSFLDEQYASFGIVTSGMDTVDKIAAIETGVIPQLGWEDVPASPIVIKSITIQ